MSTTVELSVERLSGVLGGVARERGDPNSVRVCGGRHADVCARGHDPDGTDAQVTTSARWVESRERGDTEGELRAERGDGRAVRQMSTHTLTCPYTWPFVTRLDW